MNFCINCIHFRASKIAPKKLTIGKCARKIEYDPVTGDEELAYCSTERLSTMPCGKDGLHFQAAERTPDFRDFQTTPPDSSGCDLTTFGSKLEQGD
jgi:hypothetical protein